MIILLCYQDVTGSNNCILNPSNLLIKFDFKYIYIYIYIKREREIQPMIFISSDCIIYTDWFLVLTVKQSQGLNFKSFIQLESVIKNFTS